MSEQVFTSCTHGAVWGSEKAMNLVQAEKYVGEVL